VINNYNSSVVIPVICSSLLIQMWPGMTQKRVKPGAVLMQSDSVNLLPRKRSSSWMVDNCIALKDNSSSGVLYCILCT
jgi:hypothetical protein